MSEESKLSESINYSWDLTKEKTMDLMSELEGLKETVVTTVRDTHVASTVSNVISDEKNKIRAAYDTLCARGKQSDAYKFITKCINALKEAMYKVLGHIKDVWARVLAWFNRIGSKQLEMSV